LALPHTDSSEAQARQLAGIARWQACLLLGAAVFACLLLAVFFLALGAYTGWQAGSVAAREGARASATMELQQQCQRVPADLDAGNVELALMRLDALWQAAHVPACWYELAPTAHAALRHTLSSPSPAPAASATPAPNRHMTATTPAPTAERNRAFDLPALLAEAQAALEQGDYSDAISTLDAIASVDKDFQRARVRQMLHDALSRHALTLYRSGKLSEAILQTNRAELYDDVGELNYERYVAELYLRARRNLGIDPGEAARLFTEIALQYSPNYMNGAIQGDRQAALGAYGEALLLQGDPCQSLAQLEQALALQPAAPQLSRDGLVLLQQQATAQCHAQTPTGESDAADTAPVQTQPVGTRTEPSTPAEQPPD